jgi:hypothetical protein
MRGLKGENALQYQVINGLVAHAVEGRLRAVFFHVPNGFWRSKRQARLLKALGVFAGVSDIPFLWATGSGVIELKDGDNTLQQTQKDFFEWCDLNGVRRAACWTWPAVEAVLKSWGVLDA